MAVKTKKAFVQFPSTCGFLVKRFLNLEKCLKKRRGELKKNEVVFLSYIWRQDVSLQWCKGSKSLLSGRFGYPYGRPGDSFYIRETPELSGRVGKSFRKYAIFSERFLNNATIQASVCSLAFDVLAEIPAILNYGETVGARASKTTADVSFVAYDNRQSSNGFNSNSLYGEAYHQIFILQIKKKIKILNGNNNFWRMRETQLEIFAKEITRPIFQGHAI